MCIHLVVNEVDHNCISLPGASSTPHGSPIARTRTKNKKDRRILPTKRVGTRSTSTAPNFSKKFCFGRDLF